MAPRLSAASLRTPSCGTKARTARARVRRKHGRTGEAAAQRALQGKIDRIGSAKLRQSERGVSPGKDACRPSTGGLAVRDRRCMRSARRKARWVYMMASTPARRTFDETIARTCRSPMVCRTNAARTVNGRSRSVLFVAENHCGVGAGSGAVRWQWPRGSVGLVGALRHSARGALGSARVGPLWPQRPR